MLIDDGKSCVASRNQRNKEVIQHSVSPPRRFTNNFIIPLLKVNLVYVSVTKGVALDHRGAKAYFQILRNVSKGPEFASNFTGSRVFRESTWFLLFSSFHDISNYFAVFMRRH